MVTSADGKCHSWDPSDTHPHHICFLTHSNNKKTCGQATLFEPRWGIFSSSLCWNISWPHADLQPCQEPYWGAGYLLPHISAALTGQEPCSLLILPSASLTWVQNLCRKHPPHPPAHFSSSSCHAPAVRVSHAMSPCVVTSSLGSKRLSPGSERLLATARVARQDDVQLICPSGSFHTEGTARGHLHGPLLPLLDGYRPCPEAGSLGGGSKPS